MDKDAVDPEFPFAVVQKVMAPSYIYRLPDNPDLCYRFASIALTKQQLKNKNRSASLISHIRVLCPGCKLVYAQKMKQKQPIQSPNCLKVENCSMEFDPALGHVDGCEPVKYNDIIKMFSKVTEENEEKRHGFLLEKVVRTDTHGLVHRTKDDPSKCRRFNFLATQDECFTVRCTFCSKFKDAFWAYKVNERGFMEDPRLHHTNGCRPENLEEKYMTLDNDAAKPIIGRWIRVEDEITLKTEGQNQNGNGSYIGCDEGVINDILINKMDKASAVVDFPVEVVQRVVQPSYIYRLPDNPDLCYRFATNPLSKQQLQSRHRTSRISHVRTVCPGCRFVYAQKMKQKQPISCPNSIKVESCSMEFDPALGHVDGCEPVKYNDIIKMFSKVTEENEEKRHGFILEKVVRTDTHGVIHRSKDDPTKCLRFIFHVQKDDCFTVRCWSCCNSKDAFWVYKVNEGGFMEDPRLHHAIGCRPEILSKKYMTLDNDAATRMISSWIRKEDEKRIETEGQNQSGNGRFGFCIYKQHTKAHPTRIVEVTFRLWSCGSKNPIRYLYRIPESDECYIFRADKFTFKCVSMVCKTCSRNYQISKCKGPLKIRTSDGFSLKDNPLLEHRTDCKPIKYSLAIKDYKVVESKNQLVGEYEYQLVKLRETGGLKVLHRLENEPSKCYIFNYFNRSKSGWLFVDCKKCALMQKPMRIQKRKSGVEGYTSTFRHRFSEAGFLDDPSTQHLPNCTPLCFETTMKKYQYVDKATARGFINGTCDPPVTTDDNNGRETDFPVLVVQKRNAVSFIYDVSSTAYIFHQLKHGDNSRLFCATCLSPDDIGPNADVAIRISDGFSMETDPTMNHLKHCRPPATIIVWKGTWYVREDGATSASRKYDFPLVKRSIRENYSAIYRLPDDPDYCYSLKSIRYVLKSRYLLVKCSGCSAQVGTNRRQPAKEICVAAGSFRLTSSGFLDDPTLRHIPGCEKLRFEDIMRENVITEGQEASDFFNHNYSSTQTHGIVVKRKQRAKHNTPDLCENKLSSLSNDETQESGELSEAMANKPRQSRNRLMKDVKEDASENGEKFSRMFEFPFFTEDEVKVSLVGRTLTVKCLREVCAPGVAGCFLSYSIELPPSVDISTALFRPSLFFGHHFLCSEITMNYVP